MTWTWDPTALGTSALQQTRASIGDTQTSRQLLSDEQINWRLDQYDDSVPPAAIRCVQDIIAQLARDVDRSNVGSNASRSQQIQHYKDLLAELRTENASLCEMYVGGLSDDAEDSINSDTDYRQMGIKKGWGRNDTETGTDEDDD